MIKRKLILFLLIILSGCGQSKPKEEHTAKTTDNTRANPTDFTLSDMSGQAYTLSAQKGKVVLVDFWATWCPPCRMEIPELIKLYNKYNPQGLIMLGIGLDKENSLKSFAQQNGIPYPILLGNDIVAKAYNVQGIPTTYLIDKEGKIAFLHVGLEPGIGETLDKEIVTLLKE